MPTPTRPTAPTQTTQTTQTTQPADGSPPSLNLAVLAGTLIAEPVISELSTGEIVASLSVRSTDAKGRKCSSPVRWVDPGRAVHRLHADQDVVIIGRVVRRFFRSGGQVISRTEIVASNVLRPSQKVTRIRALESAAGAIIDFVGSN